jgi:hypothetical protein
MSARRSVKNAPLFDPGNWKGDFAAVFALRDYENSKRIVPEARSVVLSDWNTEKS